MSKQANKLLRLAQERFENLTESESRMIRAAANGEECDVRVDESEPTLTRDSKPCCWGPWHSHRVVRAEVLRWLCVDPEAKSMVDPRGVQLLHAKIEGALQLQGVTVPFALALGYCAIPEDITMWSASLTELNLEGSHIGKLGADRLQVYGSVYLRSGFVARNEVRLVGASLGGQLNCSGGTFLNAKGIALCADGLTTNGDVLLRNGFVAEGEVRVPGATIGGDLDCAAGVFHNVGGKAIIADGLRTKGCVFLRDGFRSHGKVQLVGATIGGILSCNGGVFQDFGGIALAGQFISVVRGVFLQRGFLAFGEVSLLGASIGGDLCCNGGTLCNRSSVALSADRLEAGGNVYMNMNFLACGTVRLAGVSINGDLDFCGGTFVSNSPHAIVLQTATVNGALMMSSIKAWSGALELTRARIGYLVDTECAWPEELVLTGCRYDAVFAGSPCDAKRRLDWLERHDRTVKKLFGHDPHARFDPQPYRQLASVLQRQGHEADAKKIMIAAANKEWGQTRHPVQWVVYLIFWLFIGHGYRRWQPLPWLVGMFALGSALFACNPGLMQPSQPLALQALEAGETAWVQNLDSHGDGAKYPAFSPFAFTMDTLVPLVNLHQESFWQPRPGWLRCYMWFHIGMGWFLTTLFVVGLTGLVRRVTTGGDTP